MIHFGVVSLFPEIFHSGLGGLVQSAKDKGLYELKICDLRDFGKGTHRAVDDEPYGGGDGMLLQAEPLYQAVKSLKAQPELQKAQVINLSPKGQKWNQKLAEKWAQESSPKILICGRYAGMDQRFIDDCCDEEVSIGDYILNGGETAALVVLESVIRLLEGALGNQVSAQLDSYSGSTGLLEAPQYTRPQQWQGTDVPKALTMGHHQKISLWKEQASLLETALKRPDLLTFNHWKKLEQFLETSQALAEMQEEDKTKLLLQALQRLKL